MPDMTKTDEIDAIAAQLLEGLTDKSFDWSAPHTQGEYEEENARIFAVNLANAIDNEILEDCLMSLAESRGFVPLTKEAMAEPKIKKLKNPVASPTVKNLDWLLLLPAKSKDDTTLDKAMFLDAEQPPELIMRGADSYKLNSVDWSEDRGAARYIAAEPLLGQSYRDWDELKRAASGKVDAQIDIWKAEFGAVIDEAIGDGAGITSIVLADEDKGKYLDKHFKYADESLFTGSSDNRWADPDMARVVELLSHLSASEMTGIIRNSFTKRDPVNPTPVDGCQHERSGITGYILMDKCEEMFCRDCRTHWLRKL